MGLAKLMKATVILPRTDTQEAVSKLAELEWFHALPSNSEHSNPNLDDLVLKAQKSFQDIEEVMRALGVQSETGIITTMFKGAPKGTTDYVIEDIRHFIEDLENKNKEILSEPKNVLIERNRITKELEEYNNIVVALKMAASLNLDLAAFRKLKRFYAEIFVIDSRDIEEVTKSLNDLLVYSNKLNDEKSVVIVFGSNEDSERVTKYFEVLVITHFKFQLICLKIHQLLTLSLK